METKTEIIFVAETNQRFDFGWEKKTTTDNNIFLLAETKSKVFFCIGKLKIHILFCSDMSEMSIVQVALIDSDL